MDQLEPHTWGAVITATLIGIAAIVGAFARPLFSNIFAARRPSDCRITETAVEHIRELHDWHGPDHQGEQGWRGHGIERGLAALAKGQGEMNENLRELVEIARKTCE